LAAFLKSIGYIIPLMDAEYANYYTREVMDILIREFKSPGRPPPPERADRHRPSPHPAASVSLKSFVSRVEDHGDAVPGPVRLRCPSPPLSLHPKSIDHPPNDCPPPSFTYKESQVFGDPWYLLGGGRGVLGSLPLIPPPAPGPALVRLECPCPPPIHPPAAAAAGVVGDEEMKKIVLKVVKQCVATEGVQRDYVREEIVPPFFKNFWIKRMALDRRNYKQLVDTTVEVHAPPPSLEGEGVG